jgi:hypothetical protein
MDVPKAIRQAASELSSTDQEAALKVFRAMIAAVKAGAPADEMPENVKEVFAGMTPRERNAAIRFCRKVDNYASA